MTTFWKSNDLSVIRSGKLVISDINLEIAKGEFVGIVGPNGSGKTTLLLSILGILKANTGKIRFTAASRCPGKMMGEYLGFLKQHQIFLTTCELLFENL